MPETVVVKSLVGIGDLFAIAGQSNAAGMVTNQQIWESASGYSVTPTLFGNDYNWWPYQDHSDRPGLGQVDTVSSDLGNIPPYGGSHWTNIIPYYLQSQTGIPIAFIPCAKSSSSSAQWLPGSNHFDRSTLYGSCAYRIKQAGGVKAVLWWQGETDALNNVTGATYQANLSAIASAFNTDVGAPLMPTKLQRHTGSSISNQDAINNAIGALWGTGSVLTGPDLTVLNADLPDVYHLKSDINSRSAGTLWWNAIKAAFGW